MDPESQYAATDRPPSQTCPRHIMVKCCICGIVLFHALQSFAFAPPSAFFMTAAKTNTAGKFPYPEDISSVYHHMDNVDKKKPSVLGTTAFAASAVLGVPFWCTVLLPFTVFSTAANLFWVLLRGPTNKAASIHESHDENDQEKDITPTNSRKYDLVLLGVTGFTGKLAATYLAKQYCGECLFNHNLSYRCQISTLFNLSSMSSRL